MLLTGFGLLQVIKKAILSDMTKLGKEAGLKSFEQVIHCYWELGNIDSLES